MLNRKISSKLYKIIKSLFSPPLQGHDALTLALKILPKDSVILDIGAGRGQVHAKIFRENGFKVVTNDIFENADICGFYQDLQLTEKYDAIWLCHVLEHVLDVHSFLMKIKNDVKDGGWLIITVPPLKHNIVGGHVSLFNPGILLYRLILAGFDCSNAKIKTYGYNISIVLKVKKIQALPILQYDRGDIELLSEYFPFKASQNFNGKIKELNWRV